MTLTLSRINDEFKLIQEILALCPGLGVPFNLYNMTVVITLGWVQVEHVEYDDLYPGLRCFVKYVLRRYW